MTEEELKVFQEARWQIYCDSYNRKDKEEREVCKSLVKEMDEILTKYKN
jgi:hypothetical protein